MSKTKINNSQKPINVCTKSDNGAHYWINRWGTRIWRCDECGYTTNRFPMSWEEAMKGRRNDITLGEEVYYESKEESG